MTYPVILTHHSRIHELIDDEVHRQLEGRFKYVCSDRELPNALCFAVLVKEIGEVGRALLEADAHLVSDTHFKDLKKELIQVAAIAVAWASKI